MQEKKRKQAETERKRAEVRARLEEASKAKKAKKGFMTPDRKKKLRVSPLFVFSFLNLVSRPSEFSKLWDILFKNSISHREFFVIFFFFVNGSTVNVPLGLQMFYITSILLSQFYITSILLHRIVHYRQPSRTPRSRFYLIASSHAIIFSRVVRVAGQYRGNSLCTLCASIFSWNISCNGHIYFPITFSYFLRSSSSSFNVLFSSVGVGARPKLFQVYPIFLPLLYGPALHSLFCFYHRATSCRIYPCASPPPIHISLHALSRTFAVAVHKVFRVCRLPLGESFCVCQSRRHVIFP